LSHKGTQKRLSIKNHPLNNFDTIYKDHYQSMYYVALKMINDRDAVQDILQDVFIYYYKRSQNSYNIKEPKSWLMRATINKCIDYSRQQKKKTGVERLGLVPDEEEEKKPDEEFIRKAMELLKPREKTLAILYSEGMSYKEISEMSGIKYSSVGKMLSRTIKKLDEILKKMGYEMYQ